MSKKPFTVLLFVSLFLILITGLTVAQSDGEALPTFSTTFFVGSGDCASCHSRLRDENGLDISYDADWRASTMANSAKDPLWQAKVESEVLHTPALQGAIEDKCATCHMPMAHTEAHNEESTAAVFADGFLDEEHPLHLAALDGTSCALCHQISSAGLGDASTFSGHYPIDTSTWNHRAIYGRYRDPDVQIMTGFVAEDGQQMGDSAGCATCHTLYTTAFDEAGTLIPGYDPFPEQVPFLEWQNSDFGDGLGADTSCQDCHLPPVAGAASIANRGRAPLREDFGLHHFAGSNGLILEILRDNGDELGVTASSDHFNQTIDRTEKQLAGQTAVISVAKTKISAATASLDLLVSNLTGHKFPTGIPIRRSWIHLQAIDANGQMLFESGAPLADGRIAGNDADLDLAAFEPHYERITAPDQVQIYEGVMFDWNNEVTYTLLRATAFAKDNRLLPSGFDKKKAPADIQVFGRAKEDRDFTGGSDAISYDIPVANAAWPVTIHARLLFQPIAPSFVQDLGLDGGQYVDRFLGYHAAAVRGPDLVSEVETRFAGP